MEIWKKIRPFGKSKGIILDQNLLDGHGDKKEEDVLIDIKAFREAKKEKTNKEKEKKEE